MHKYLASKLLFERKLLLIALLVSSFNVFSQVNQEMVLNGSFESSGLYFDESSLPVNWLQAGFYGFRYYYGPRYVPNNEFGTQYALPLNTGQGYLFLENGDPANPNGGNFVQSARAGIQLRQPMEKGSTYLIQAQVSRAENINRNAEFKFQISKDTRTVANGTIRPRNKITIGKGSVNSTHGPDNKDWKPIRFTYKHDDDDPFPYFYVKAKGVGYSGFYLDNVSVQKLDACGIECCPDYEIFQNTSYLPAFTSTKDYIKAGYGVLQDDPLGDVNVLTGQKITFQATNQITLYPGFKVQAGGEFAAKIGACNVSEPSVRITPTLKPCSHLLCATVCGSSTNYTLTWSDGLGSAQQIEVSPAVPTTYTVTVRDNNTGKTASQSYTVVPDYFKGAISHGDVPNVFTPNGDGINDYWYVPDGGKTSYAYNAYRYELTIVDRWGRPAFYSDSETTVAPGFSEGDIQWDGYRNDGARVPSGTVLYWGVKFYNCDGIREINGWVQPLYGSSSRISYEKDDLENILINDDLFDAFPNPASTSTIIEYSIAKKGAVKLSVRDLTGKEVKTIVKENAHEKGIFSTSLNIAELKRNLYVHATNSCQQDNKALNYSKVV